jgi:TPP-dependent 2-oxoacid decarboxylase
MAKKRVADVLVDTVVAAGVKRVYGLVGDSLNGVTDSIRPRKDLQWVPVRHEETAAFAAQTPNSWLSSAQRSLGRNQHFQIRRARAG